MNENILKRKSRELAINYLYNMDLMGYENMNLKNEMDLYALKLANDVINNLTKIDEIISKNLYKYTLTRLNYVDKAIVRIAVCELLNGLAKEIVINEAVELSKIYTKTDDTNTSAFNNKLLDNIAKSLC